jgi:hypothetical protein
MNFRFTGQNILAEAYSRFTPLSFDFSSRRLLLPKRVEGNSLYKFTRVINKEAHCDNLEFKLFNVSSNNTYTSSINRSPPILWPEQVNKILFLFLKAL